MAMLQEILAHNKSFVAKMQYEAFATGRFPDKKLAILSCMDTRLTALLPAALNLKNGDAKMIQNAGGVVSHPFGSVMRSLLVAVYELEVEEILVIGHYDCGMQGIDADAVVEKMRARGVSQGNIDMIEYCGIDFKKWLKGFEDVQTSVRSTVQTIVHHPLIPKDVSVRGFVIDPETGRLDAVDSEK